MSDYYYKIMDYEGGNFRTLFHGLNGSKTVPMYEWLQARVAIVSDGTNGTKYKSGWHVFTSFDECQKYLKKFQNLKNKVIAKCNARNLWPKEHSRSNVLLAEWINIVGVSGGKKIL